MKIKIRKSFLIVLLCLVTLNVTALIPQKVSAVKIGKYKTEVNPIIDETVTGPEVKYGWNNSNGKWSYTDGESKNYSNGIFTIEGEKYLFDNNGYLCTGIQKNNGKIYYFSEEGDSPYSGLGRLEAYIGWKTLNSDIYYFNADNSISTGWETISGKQYYFSDNGKLQKGWTKIGKNTFYFKNSGKLGEKGKMLTGWRRISKNIFYFSKKGKKGKLVTGVKKIRKNKFYFKPNGKAGYKGALQTGWKKIGKSKYFLTVSGKTGVKGKMVKNRIAGNKKLGYGFVDSNGKRITTKAITLATKFVLKHTSKNQSKKAKLKTCFDYLWRNYSYKRIYGFPTKSTLSKDYAQYMFTNKHGNCFCYGTTFSCIARVLGYRSRVGTGLIEAAGGGMTPHGWSEVKINGKWYIFDPDMQKNIPGISSYMRTRYNYPYSLICNNHYTLTFKNSKTVWIKGK